MPFLQAGFNAANYKTGIRGWTRHVRDDKRRFAPAELRRFDCDDYFWFGERRDGTGFVSWGECVVLGSHWAFDLPWEYQNGLAHSDLETREEHPAWKWVEKRRAAM